MPGTKNENMGAAIFPSKDVAVAPVDCLGCVHRNRSLLDHHRRIRLEVLVKTPPDIRCLDLFKARSREVPTLSPGPACHPESFLDGP